MRVTAVRFFCVIMAVALALSAPGCQQDTAALDSRGGASLLRGAAQAILAGRAYDRATLAARHEDTVAMAAAAARVRLLGESTLVHTIAREAAEKAVSSATASATAADHLYRVGNSTLAQALVQRAAEESVDAAVAFDILAEKFTGAEREQWRGRAAAAYREALRVMPDFNSRDRDKLNALGYFLADRGTTPDDFEVAERLTRKSLKLWDEQLAQLDENHPLLPMLRFERAVGAHDSLAWALYRQRRYEEALRELTAAIASARAASSASATGIGPVSSDLYFHLGEIYRALQRPQDARRQYFRALRLNPGDTASRRALQELRNSRRLKATQNATP